MFLPAAAAAENLQQAWSDAIASHNQLAAAALRREAAGLNLESAQAERWPRLDVTSSFTQLDEAPRFDFGGGTTSQPLFDNDNFMQAGVQVSLPLYAGGAISAGVGAAEFAAEASEEQYGAMLQNIKLGTGEHYVQILRAESGLEVAESNVRTLQAHTELAHRQYEFGSVPKNDFLAASVALADAEQRKLQAENALDYSRAAYNRFLNRPLDQPVALDPKLDIDHLVPAGETLESLILTATEQRNELAVLKAEANSLRENSTAIRARSRPQFALTGGYMYLENAFLTADEFWMAGVSFQWGMIARRPRPGPESRKPPSTRRSRTCAWCRTATKPVPARTSKYSTPRHCASRRSTTVTTRATNWCSQNSGWRAQWEHCDEGRSKRHEETGWQSSPTACLHGE
jgi:outer membrane protein TolC